MLSGDTDDDVPNRRIHQALTSVTKLVVALLSVFSIGVASA